MGRITYFLCDNPICGVQTRFGDHTHWLQVQSYIPHPHFTGGSHPELVLTNPFIYCSHLCAQQHAEEREASAQ